LRIRLIILACVPGLLVGQSRYFLGGVGGLSTLSADGRSLLSQSPGSVSLYKPENGPTFQFFGGLHWTDYLSLQASYGWNRNSLTLTSVRLEDNSSFYQQMRRVSQHSFIGELMLYFRNRKSFARPYLSVGTGVVHLRSSAGTVTRTTGTLVGPGSFSSTKPALRVAVGIDLVTKTGWGFRYSFSETIRQNAISTQLVPPGRRNLANFQNLFGLLKTF
jgi:hypothetical protein